MVEVSAAAWTAVGEARAELAHGEGALPLVLADEQHDLAQEDRAGIAPVGQPVGH